MENQQFFAEPMSDVFPPSGFYQVVRRNKEGELEGVIITNISYNEAKRKAHEYNMTIKDNNY